MKKRINIERIAFIASILSVYAITTFFLDGDDSKWNGPLLALFLLPSLYFTFSYAFLGGGDKVFWDEVAKYPNEPMYKFSWRKYFKEFIFLLFVIGGILLLGAIAIAAKWVFKQMGG
jgi:hypothetical protein